MNRRSQTFGAGQRAVVGRRLPFQPRKDYANSPVGSSEPRLRNSMQKPVRKAVFPVAGLGTRILPATKAMPKEMLTIVDKPLIHYAMEEAKAAGIEQFYFVTGRNKNVIEDHFDRMFELDATLAA